MHEYQGKRIFEGYALGRIIVYKNGPSVEKKEGLGPDKEFERFRKARETTVRNLEQSYLSALASLGEEEAQLFKTHELMAEDLDFEDLVKKSLGQGVTAEYAVKEAAEELRKMFLAMDDDYMRARGKDVTEVGDRIIGALKDEGDGFALKEPSIVVCEDLPSSELMKLDKKLLLGLVMTEGSTNSHVSILTRMLEIPCICELDLDLRNDIKGRFAVLDGSKGKLIVDPTPEVLTSYKKVEEAYRKEKEELRLFVNKPTLTKDGKKTKIYANIASSYEVENAIRNDAEGIGLFRSEFIYLESKDYPGEDEQFEHYKRVVSKMKGKEVIIRTLDIGADKKVSYFNLPKEENPALGYRSIRICEDRPEVFLVQLMALYRASAYGHLSIMIPMIISLEEVQFVHMMCRKAMDNLEKRGMEYDKNVKVGIMVETPAAAIMSDVLAQNVDFFSIGTNDLTQYTLAVDRVNPNLGKSFNPHHHAVLRLINYIAGNAHKAGIPVGICGELARDEELLPFFLKAGIDELSVSPAYCLSLRKKIADIDTGKVDLHKYLD